MSNGDDRKKQEEERLRRLVAGGGATQTLVAGPSEEDRLRALVAGGGDSSSGQGFGFPSLGQVAAGFGRETQEAAAGVPGLLGSIPSAVEAFAKYVRPESLKEGLGQAPFGPLAPIAQLGLFKTPTQERVRLEFSKAFLRSAINLSEAVSLGSVDSSGAEELHQSADRQLTAITASGRVDPGEAKVASFIGGSLGYVPAGMLSWKAAGLLGTMDAPIAREVLTGAIYGAGFGTGGPVERAKEAGVQAGLGLVFGAIFNPSRLAFTGYRAERANLKRERDALFDRLAHERDNTTGLAAPVLDETTAGPANDIISEEMDIVQAAMTPGARVLRDQFVDERAYIAAKEARRAGGSHILVRGVQNIEESLAKIKESFPNFRINTRIVSGTQGDIIVGPKGLSTRKRHDLGGMSPLEVFQKTGHFPGQRALIGTKEYEYMGITRGGRARLKDVHGKTYYKNESILTWLDEGMATFDDVDDVLVDDLIRDWETTVDNGAASIVEGTQPTGIIREMPDSPGAVMTSEEMGVPTAATLDPDGTVMQAYPNVTFHDHVLDWARRSQLYVRRLARNDITDMPLSQEVKTKTGKWPWELTETEFVKAVSPVTGQVPTLQYLSRGLPNRGKPGYHLEKDIVDTNYVVHRNSSGDLDGVLMIVPDDLGEPGLLSVAVDPSSEGKGIATRLYAVARQSGFDIDKAIGKHGLTEGGARLQYSRLRDMAKRGTKTVLPTDLDVIEHRAAFKIRERLRSHVPPDELAIYDDIAARFDKAVEDNALNLDFLAHARQHSIRRLPDGRILARHLDYGTPQIFTNEQAAINGLLGVKTTPLNSADGMLHPTLPSAGGGSIGGSPVDADGPMARDKSESLFFDPVIEQGEILPTGVRKTLSAFTKDSAFFTMMHKPHFRNIIGFAQDLERATGIPIWTYGIKPVMQAETTYNNAIRPWIAGYADTFKRVSSNASLRIGEVFFYGGAGRTEEQLVALARSRGITGARELRAVRQIKLLDEGISRHARDNLGLQIESIMDLHYRVIQPLTEHSVMTLDGLKASYLAEYKRPMDDFLAKWIFDNRAALALASKDPRHVLAKFTRQVHVSQHIEPALKRLMPYVDSRNPLRMGDLTPEKLAQVNAILGKGVKGNAVTTPIQNAASVLAEFVAGVKGHVGGMSDVPADLMQRVMNGMGVNADIHTTRAFASAMFSNVYGATMGLRPSIIMRDWWQNYWNMGTRVGWKDAAESQRRTLQYETFVKWLNAGAMELESGGIAGAETFLRRDILDRLGAEAIDASGHYLGAMKRFANASELKAASLSRRLLTAYSSQDSMLRVWAAEWQYMHTQRWIRQFRAGKITESVLLDEGLPFYSPVTKNHFLKLVRNNMDEEALLFIGKEAAAESNFLYRRFVQPGWWQTPVGRLAMQFGTWPMWQAEMYYRRFFFGTGKQRARFLARNAAVAGAIGILGYETGTDLMNWMSPVQAFNFTGGPSVDTAMDTHDIMKMPFSRRARATENLLVKGVKLQFPAAALLNSDIMRSLNTAQNPEHAMYMFMFGKASDLPGNFYADVIMDPTKTQGPPLSVGNIQAALRNADNKQRIEEFTNPLSPMGSPMTPVAAGLPSNIPAPQMPTLEEAVQILNPKASGRAVPTSPQPLQLLPSGPAPLGP